MGGRDGRHDGGTSGGGVGVRDAVLFTGGEFQLEKVGKVMDMMVVWPAQQ